MICSLRTLWSRRPILVSSNSIFPQGSAFFSASALTISSIFRLAATPFCFNCKNASCAAAQASLASANTPNLPRKAGAAVAFFVPQPHDSDLGAGAGAGWEVAVLVPFKRPSTSATTSRIKVSFTALMIQLPHFRAENLFSKNIHTVHDANDDGIHGRFLHAGCQAGAAALTKQNQLSLTRPESVHGHNRVLARTKLARVLFVHELGAEQQELAARHVRVLL